jgi:hypothetical protein
MGKIMLILGQDSHLEYKSNDYSEIFGNGPGGGCGGSYSSGSSVNNKVNIKFSLCLIN